MQKLRLTFILFLALIIAACGGNTVKPTDTPKSTTKAAQKPTAKKWGGGYYKDDGPGDDIPENLDSIPNASPKVEPLHRFANRPYVVLGKSYVPNTSLKPIKQRGIASWYGKKFHGQKTSIGETYDMFAMTAAHPTLALPSYARVTNVSNGRSVIVRITDRGPFHADRIIDLSYAAAYKLDYIDKGSTLVEVETFTPESIREMASLPPPPPPIAQQKSNPDEVDKFVSEVANKPEPTIATNIPPKDVFAPPAHENGKLVEHAYISKGIFLQLGAFSNVENAENLRSHLSRELDWIAEEFEISQSSLMYRLYLGPYASRNDAEKVASRIAQALGYKPTIINR